MQWKRIYLQGGAGGGGAACPEWFNSRFVIGPHGTCHMFPAGVRCKILCYHTFIQTKGINLPSTSARSLRPRRRTSQTPIRVLKKKRGKRNALEPDASIGSKYFIRSFRPCDCGGGLDVRTTPFQRKRSFTRCYAINDWLSRDVRPEAKPSRF